MARTIRKQAFTLIELLVVVAIIALLISILLPSLQGARDQGKKAVCLSNMSQIAKASHSYAVDDDREQMIPLQKMNVLSIHASGGWPGDCNKTWRTALPFAFGGRTPVKPMLVGNLAIEALCGQNPPDPEAAAHWRWGAPTRPLNRYVYGELSTGDFYNLPMYLCPADVGYPEFDPADWGGAANLDWPVASAFIPCYDFVGNSYRINTAGLIWTKTGGANGADSRFRASFSVGAEGHASSAIENPSRVAMYCDPLFYFWSRQGEWDPGMDPDKILFPGWHKKIMSDNVAFCDGSAKLVKIDSLAEWDQETLDAMNFSKDFGKEQSYYFLRRGRTWQTDCYPSPGALIKVYNPNGTSQFDPAKDLKYSGWPFDNYTQNLCPF